ncbi:MAG: arsenite methyltransferase [Candidatus Hydrogenedentes bacterium]|nr:arsenite methyltransferase [Candidatus Hydrogenedentota bacterium]
MSDAATLDTQDKVRAEVSKSYARAIEKTKASEGCCGQTACCGSSSAATTNVEAIGYRIDEVAELPTDAVVSSFGCGNPLAFSGVKEGDTVLDLGSGAGLDLLIARKKVGETGRVIGVDMTDAMIERARGNIAKLGYTNVEVRKGIIEKMPVESGTVDWVISNCVINLSPDKPRVFAEIARVLKPGGQMSVSDIVANDLPWWARKSMSLYASCIGGAISEEAYIAGLRQAGLTNVEVKERLVYDRDQIDMFIADMLPKFLGPTACVLQGLVQPILSRIGARIAGNIWSAKFAAAKPA